MSTFQVYVSSTFLDLEAERQAVEHAIQRMRDTKFLGMEYFGARNESTLHTSVAELDFARVYVGIFAGRYGSGITEQEYRRARELGKRCLIYFKDTASTDDEWHETEAARTRLRELKAELASSHVVCPFTTPDDLAAKVTADLHKLLFDEFASSGERRSSELDDALRTYFGNDYDRSLRDYLNAVQQFTESSYRSLPFPEGKRLSDVYIELHLRSESTGMQGTIRDLLSDGARPAGTGLFIEAGPGAGKSTLLRHIARNAWEHPEAVGLSGRRLPLLVRLSAVAQAGGVALEERLWSAIGQAKDIVMNVPPPRGWFDAWPARMSAPWLLLLDGLDEVAHERQHEVITWMREVLRRGTEVLMTSRPVDDPSKAIPALFSSYTLAPLKRDEQTRLSQQWLGTETGTFRDQLDRLQVTNIAGTPLLVTIAAIVFKRDGGLPTTRASLYLRFVDAWWHEALHRGIGEELGPDLSDVARSGLQYLAWFMIGEPLERTRAALAVSLRQFLAAVPGQLSYLSPNRVDRFLEVMGRRSGVLQSSGGEYGWLHRSFCEFLAGEFIACNAPESSAAAEACRKWYAHDWRDAVLFALGLWSDGGHDMTAVLRRLIEDATSGRTAAGLADRQPWSAQLPEMSVVFAARAVGEGVTVEPSFRERLLEELLTKSREYARQSLGERMLTHVVKDHTAQVLAAFTDAPDVKDRLDALARDLVSIVRGWNGARGGGGPVAVRDLAALRRFDDLLSLASDAKLHPYCRYCAVRELTDQGGAGDTVATMLEILRMPEFARWIENGLRSLLKRAGPKQLVVIARDEGWPLPVRSWVPAVLHKANLTSETYEIVQDESIPAPVRLRAAQLLHTPGKDDTAASAILAILERQLRDNASDTTALFCRANLNSEQERWAAVIDDCNAVLDSDPNHSDAAMLRGWAFMATDHLREAIADFDRAEPLLKTEMSRWFCLTRRAVSYARLHEPAAALVDFDAAAKIVSGPELGRRYTWYRPWYGLCLAAAGRHEEAFALLNVAVADDSRSAMPLAARGATFESLGRYDEAIDDFSRALEQNSDDLWVRRRRAECYRRIARPAEAIADLTHILTNVPDHAITIIRRLLLYLENKADAEAIAGIDTFRTSFILSHAESTEVEDELRQLQEAHGKEVSAAPARARLAAWLRTFDKADDPTSISPDR
jgi:tetratricopeptide (TPR) repeat protein